MSNNTTTLITSTPSKPYSELTIETRTVVANSAKHGAGDPYKTDNIVGVSNRHAGEKAYGPEGAFIDTGDARGRDIHGGGTGLKDPFAPQQGWVCTLGCARGQNQDVIKLGEAIKSSQQDNPNVPIPYVRTTDSQQKPED